MKTYYNNKKPYHKGPSITEPQLYTGFYYTRDGDHNQVIGMPTHSLDQIDAAQKYYAAFPALSKGEELQPYYSPPSWCRKSDAHKLNMQNDLCTKEWNLKNKKIFGKDRRNTYHGKKTSKRRCNSYSKAFESKENLPEWVTHEGVWDIETQDPVREFIRAIALDEGYGTCENTFTDEIREIHESFKMKDTAVPDFSDSLDLDVDWVITEDLTPKTRTPMEEELYAKFEAKFDRSIEALWSKDQANTPDDEYQDLPIDFQDLLSSPSDHQYFESSNDKQSILSLTENIWSNDLYSSFLGGQVNIEASSNSVEILHDRFKPLNLTDNTFVAETRPLDHLEPFSLYNCEGIYEAVPSVADVMRSLTTLNHSRNYSSFTEVLPRKHIKAKLEILSQTPHAIQPPPARYTEEREDLLTSSKTHFRPIKKEAETESKAVVRYADGATFDICGELDDIKSRRSESGFIYVESDTSRYLEYHTPKSIDYGRLNLTEAQRLQHADFDVREFRLKFAVKQIEKGVQTESNGGGGEGAWGGCDECSRVAGAKKMRQSGIDTIWSGGFCGACSRASATPSAPPAPPEELSREWEELLCDISAAHAHYTEAEGGGGGDRKRRHSAARCSRATGLCSHPHAPFLHCCALDRPLTR